MHLENICHIFMLNSFLNSPFQGNLVFLTFLGSQVGLTFCIFRESNWPEE